ncbi:hypothetical protein DUI87_30998 [Hirundo rustica rustica]|uniref:ribonuclease H n=1 Tax=Hirundo rustica rustica TaxID=333673 RepID=A0A3M0J1M0_HIRRU|nr:hypothetical protein DUI87_30998 [Hirundo rustica rustica]
MRKKINSEVWYTPDSVGRLNIPPFSVIIKDPETPIRVKQYPISPEGKNGLKPEIERLLSKGLLESCMSPFNTPILPIKKADGSYWLVHDLREINKRTVACFPVVANPYTLLSRLGPEKQYYSVIDLKDAFWACPLDEKNRDYLAFEWEDPVTHRRQQLRWTVLPQGFTESPNLFGQALEQILQEYQTGEGVTLIQYVDDLLIAGEAEDKVRAESIRLLNFLSAKGLKVSKAKLQFVEEVKYLGHYLRKGEKKIDPERVKGILSIPPPKSKKQIRQLLGLMGYCRQWIENYSTKVKFLYEKLSQGGLVKWDEKDDKQSRRPEVTDPEERSSMNGHRVEYAPEPHYMEERLICNSDVKIRDLLEQLEARIIFKNGEISLEGYKNSPTIFGEQLAKDLESWEPPPGEGQLLQYVDELLIATQTQETCVDWTVSLLNFLGLQGYRVSQKKAQMVRQTVIYLGYEVSAGQRTLGQDRKEAICQTPKPQTVKELRTFLGMTGWCRLWIYKYGLLVKPLYALITEGSRDLQWTKDATRAFDKLKKVLMLAPALGLPNMNKPFFLFSHKKQGIALGILAQNLGPYRRAVAYLSKQLDTAAKGWPGCLRAVAAVAINIQEARKFTLGQKMTVLVSHTMSAVLEAKGGHWLSPQRFLKYQAILVEQDDVEIVVTNIVNPASFLSGSMGEPVIHDCLETIEATYSSRQDLKDTPLEDAETWFTDGSSYVVSGRRHAGYAVTTSREVIESGPLPTNTSAQKAEIIALIRALELAKGKEINIYTDSRYAFGVVHAHRAIWKERGLLNSQGKSIKHAQEILRLLDAVQLPEKVAIMHIKAHQKVISELEKENMLVDRAAKVAAKGEVPDGKISIEGKPIYNKKDKKLIKDGKTWPENGSLQSDMISQLLMFCKREGKRDEVPYVDLFFYLREKPEWLAECGLMIGKVPENNKCMACVQGKRCLEHLALDESLYRKDDMEGHQVILDTLMDSTKKEMVLRVARERVREDIHNGLVTGTLDYNFPTKDPLWDPNDPSGVDVIRLKKYQEWIQIGVQNAIPKTMNWSKLYEIRQESKESPTAFLERLKEAARKYTDLQIGRDLLAKLDAVITFENGELLMKVCTEYHKNQTKITPPVPRKAVITQMPAIPEVEEQITPVVTKTGPYAIKKTGVQKLIV